MRRFAALAAGCALLAPSSLAARPLTLEDLLAQERLGAIKLDAAQRWLVVQSYGRRDRARLYDMDDRYALGLGRVQVFELEAGGHERRLDLDPAGGGYVAGPLSPSGARMAVYRIDGHAVDLGVVELATGKVVWTGLTPRLEWLGRAIAWRGETSLIVSTRPADQPDGFFGWGWAAQTRLPALWARQARGEASVSLVGSGRWLGLRARFAPGAVVALDLASGRQTVLAQGDVVDLELSPDAKTLALVETGQDLQPGPEPAKSGDATRARRLRLVEVATAKASAPLGERDVMLRLLSWSAGGQLMVFARPLGTTWAQGDYFAIAPGRPARALGGGAVRPRPDAIRFNGALARGAWLGETPVVRAAVEGPDGKDGKDGWWRIDGDRPRPLAAAVPPAASLVAAGPAGLVFRTPGQAVLLTPRGKVRALGAAALLTAPVEDLGDRGLQTPSPLDQTALRLGPDLASLNGARLARLAPDQSLAAIAARQRLRVDVQIDDHGVETVGLSPVSGPRVTLTRINAALADVDFVTPRAIAYTGVDGEALTAWLYLPASARASARAPLVVIPYPGEASASPPPIQAPPAATLMTNAQLLAARGYAVLVPAMPYRQGQDPSAGLADQMLAAVDAAARAAPVDPDRTALFGHSYGGYAALAAATQSPRFKAIIAAAATSSLLNAYGRQGPPMYAMPEFGPTIGSSAGWMETGQTRMGVAPWVDPERYLRNSPIIRADRITAPVLILYGDLDNDVTQAQNLYAALYRLRKDAILALYRGEFHVPIAPGNVRDMHGRIFQFLADTIGPGVAPSP